MDAYTTLVNRVLKIKVLSDEIVKITNEEENVLNLVVENWRNRLENNFAFQKFKRDAKKLYGVERTSVNQQFRIQYITGPIIKTLVVGYCNVYHPYDRTSERTQNFSITIQDSPVLNLLGKVLNSDVDFEKFHLHESSKLNFGVCSGRFCRHCSEAIDAFNEEGVNQNQQPCILDTLVYNGKYVANIFGSQITELFRGTFVAIVLLEFNMRYFFKQNDTHKICVRLGGNVARMIAFPETNLKQHSIYLGDISTKIVSKCQPNETSTDRETLTGPNNELENNDSNEFRDISNKRTLQPNEEIIDIQPFKRQKPHEEISVTEEYLHFD